MTVRNYSNIEDEVPIFWLIKLSNIIYIFLFSIVPFIFTYSAWFTPSGFILGFITLMTALSGYIFSEYRIDWRKITAFFFDKIEKKKVEKHVNFSIKKYDISGLIESLKK